MLENFRNKSESERKRIAIYVSIFLTGIVALVWFFTFSIPGLAEEDLVHNQVSLIDSTKKTSIISNFFINIKKGFSEVVELTVSIF